MRYPQVPLRRFARMYYGDALSADEREDGDIPVMGSNGSFDKHDTANLKGPCIIIGRKGSHGKITWCDSPAWVTDTAFGIDDRHTDADLRWLYYAMHTAQFDQTSLDTGVPGLPRDFAYEQRIPLAPTDEQRAIATFLDTETARIDALIATKERLARLVWLRAAAEAEQLLDRFDDVPLQYLTDARRPIVYGIVQAGPDDPNGIPYIKSGEVADLAERELSRTSATIHHQYSRSHVRPGDIVIAMRASIGTLATVPPSLPDANLTQGTARIAPRSGVNGRWLYHALRLRRVQEEMNLRAVGTTFRTLNIWDLRRIGVPTPSAEVQGQLATTLDDVQRQADDLQEGLARQIALLREHRQALITAAVTGEFEVPGVAA